MVANVFIPGLLNLATIAGSPVEYRPPTTRMKTPWQAQTLLAAVGKIGIASDVSNGETTKFGLLVLPMTTNRRLRLVSSSSS